MKPTNSPPELILPLEQAVVAAAYQNLLIDRINVPLEQGEEDAPWETYLEEARYLLKETGENYKGQHGHPTIKLATVN
jgi:hypothetical protein